MPEALEALRLVPPRRSDALPDRIETPVAVSAADPLNLCGIVVPGQRVSVLSGEMIRLLGGDDAARAAADSPPQSAH